jgi:hypothetical protein
VQGPPSDAADFRTIRQRIDGNALSRLGAVPQDWQNFFEDAIRLLPCDDHETKYFAIERISTALDAERRLNRISPKERLTPILQAIESQGENADWYIRRLTRYNSALAEGEYKDFFDAWLKKISDRSAYPQISDAAIVVAQLQLDYFPRDNWHQARGFLSSYLQSDDVNIRAAAASAIARLFESDCQDLPPLETTMREIKDLDIQRPGVAGPFWDEIQFQFEDYKYYTCDDGSKFSSVAWMGEIIAQRNGEEPYIEGHNGIDFHAHELMAGNVAAIRELIALGQESTAAMAATEINEPIEEMRDILVQLGHAEDDFVSRISCWHLAYLYKHLHPAAEARGFVRRFERDDAIIFVVYSPPESYPYAATIYPHGETMTNAVAWSWIDRLAPPSLRGDLDPPEYPGEANPSISEDEASYSYPHHIVNLVGDPKQSIWKYVWIKWPVGEGW